MRLMRLLARRYLCWAMTTSLPTRFLGHQAMVLAQARLEGCECLPWAVL